MKMPNCAAFGCTNHSNKNEMLTFHQIPAEGRNKQLRKAWLSKIRRMGVLPKDKSFHICSEHFEEDCYERDLKKELMENKPGAKKLKSDAVPTIFVFKKPIRKRKTSIERAAREEKRRLLDQAFEEAASASTSIGGSEIEEQPRREFPTQSDGNNLTDRCVVDNIKFSNKKICTSTKMANVGTQCSEVSVYSCDNLSMAIPGTTVDVSYFSESEEEVKREPEKEQAIKGIRSRSET